MTVAAISVVQTEPFDSPGLLAHAQAGDGESFGRLCEPLRERLVRQAFALCREEAFAQDLVQETLIAAWKSIHRFKAQCQLSTWLCGILLRRHKSALRRRQWKNLFLDFSGGSKEEAHHPDQTIIAPDDATVLSERSRAILRTLDRLPAKQREVIFLRFYADETLEQIGAALGCSVGTVKSRLFHGLEHLRSMRIFEEEFR